MQSHIYNIIVNMLELLLCSSAQSWRSGEWVTFRVWCAIRVVRWVNASSHNDTIARFFNLRANPIHGVPNDHFISEQFHAVDSRTSLQNYRLTIFFFCWLLGLSCDSQRMRSAHRVLQFQGDLKRKKVHVPRTHSCKCIASDRLAFFSKTAKNPIDVI